MEHHAARIAKALDYIEGNLGSPLPLEEVARRASFSEYHFHRIFGALLGQPVMTYVRKRRLTEAARRILATDDRLLDVALDSGFESQEAFTRAFKRYHGVNPGELRRRGVPPTTRQPRVDRDTLDHLMKNVTMEPSWRDFGPIRLVGLKASFEPDGDPGEIPALWGQFVPRIREIAAVADARTFGVCHCTKRDAANPGSPPRFEYMAAVPVRRIEDIPESMEPVELPARTYAVFTHRGHIGRIKDTVDYVWGTWLPRSGRDPVTDAPDFELYDERFDGRTGQGELDIYVPLEPARDSTLRD